METKKCKYCKSDININATVCPHCRKRQSNALKIITTLLFVLFFLTFIISDSDSNSEKDKNNQVAAMTTPVEESAPVEESTPVEPTAAQEESINIDDLKTLCKNFQYKKVARNPEEYKGEYFKVNVQIFSVSNGSLFSGYAKSYKANLKNDYGYYGDMIYLLDKRDTSDPDYLKILDGDIITVYGRFNGMVDTKNMLTREKGEEVAIEILYAELISE